MWIQLLAMKRIDVRGKMQAFHPGQWVNVGKHDALRWIANNEAIAPTKEKVALTRGCGIVAEGDPLDETMQTAIGPVQAEHIKAMIGEPQLAYDKTLIWHPSLNLNSGLIPVGFHLLDTWEVAVPIYDYDELANNVGDEADRERTAAVVHEMRCLLYDPRLVFVRKCPNGQALVDAWMAEREQGDDDKLAFLRALYAVKPFIVALPITWLGKHCVDG